MRHSPIACGTLRIVAEDAELAGVLFPAGTFVLVNTLAANRDTAVYDDPDRFDISRNPTPAVLTFGGGIHYCLGANLARVELAEALKILTRRMPDPSRAGPAPWKPMMGLSGPTTLPIAFSGA
jgi:cytochrome P450